MKELSSRNDVSGKELARGQNLKVAAWSAPLILAGIPAAVFLILLFIFGTTPPVAATIFFLGIILTIIGFVSGLIVSGVMAHKHSKWTKEMRERIAARGIRAEDGRGASRRVPADGRDAARRERRACEAARRDARRSAGRPGRGHRETAG